MSLIKDPRGVLVKRAFLLISAASLSAVWAFWPQPALSHETANTTVMFDREIVRILNKKCVACHTENNLGIPLTSYEQTRPWARAIEEEVLRRHMPPWRAVPGYGEFANDIGLTNRELQFIIAWVEGNGPKNQDQKLIVNVDQIKTPLSEQLRPDFSRWQLGRPDLTGQLNANTIEPGRPNEVKRVVVDMGLTSERWVRGLEFKPGDRRVVRAAFFSVQETGQWLGSWTPWWGATTLQNDVAYRVPAGSHVVAEIHYRSADRPVEDRGTLGMYFAPTPPKHCPSDLVLQADGDLVPGAARQKFRAAVKLSADTYLLALKPEVRPGAHSIEVSARKPDGTVQVLLFVKDILQEWPTPYILKQPALLAKDTELSVTSYYQTSAQTSADTPRAAGVKLTVSRYDDKGGCSATAP